MNARNRRGSALVEMLVALPIALLCSGLAAHVLVTQLRATRRVESRVQNVRELEHGAMVLAADLRSASASDLESFSDSAIVMNAPVFTAVVCNVPAPHIIDLVDAAANRPLAAVTFTTPRAGDRLRYSTPDSELLGAPLSTLDSVSYASHIAHVSREQSACTHSPLQAATGATPWRIQLSAPPAITPDNATVIAIARRVEWRSYRAGDGEYYLGRREWNGTTWSTIQPVVGPLLPSREGGFHLTVARADRSPLTSPDADARLVNVQFKAARKGTAELVDSLSVWLALRGGR